MADWGYPEIDDVVVLNNSNHDQFVKEFDEALIYYYLPKCKYCVQMDKFFGALALQYKEKEQRIPFAGFDCSKNMDFCRSLNIPAYPFVKFFIKEHPIVYYGKRTRQEIEKFLESILNKKVKQISVDDLQGISLNNILVVYFGDQNSKEFQLFDLVGKYHQELDFVHVKIPVEISEIKKIEIFKDSIFHKTDFQNDIFVIKGNKLFHSSDINTFDKIDSFVNKIKHPDLIELDDQFLKLIKKSPQEFMVLFVENENDKSIDEFQKFAHDHKKSMKFLLAIKNSHQQELFNRLKNSLLIKDNQYPIVKIFATSYSLNAIEKYQFQGKLNYNLYSNFFRDFKANKIQPYFKNQKITKKKYGNFKVLNSYNYKNEIFVSGQDSVVLYHSDFDNHKDSKKMLKILQKISKNEKFKNIKFFCIDADQNEVKTFHHNHRPVILLYSKKDPMSPLIFDKEPDYKKVKKFIKSKKYVKKNKDIEKYFNTEL